MSYTKYLMEMEEERQHVAAGILIQAGVLTVCLIHEGIILDNLGEVQGAYRRGNYLYTAHEKDTYAEEYRTTDDTMDCFESRRQMTDAIKEVYEQPYLLECPLCAKA